MFLHGIVFCCFDVVTMFLHWTVLCGYIVILFLCFQVYERLVEDILRKACSVLHQNSTIAEELSVNEIYRAIIALPECDFLTNKGLGVKPQCSAAATVQDIEK